MAYVDLVRDGIGITTEKDNVVIRLHLENKQGGAVVDTTGYTQKSIHAGHLVIQKTEDKSYALMPVDTTTKKYKSLPSGHTYAGVVIATVPTNMPTIGILTRGSVNYKACEWDMTDILSDVKLALPLITFVED